MIKSFLIVFRKGAAAMRKFAVLLLAFLLLCGTALADTVPFGSVSFDRDAESIDLGEQAVRNWSAFVSFLKEFPNLKKVDMFATTVDAARVEKLEKEFPDVEFGWNLKMMRYHIIRSDAEAYSTLHGRHPKHTSSEFALLKYCTGLKALDLGHNNITDTSFLLSMPHLRVLILGDNNNLKNIEIVGQLKELEYLELFSCGITDISPLTNLTNLMDLNLSNNRVKDWRPLKQMTWLKRLWISGICTGKRSRPDLTEAERQELEEALPDTEIVYVGEPTDNGWRFLDGKEPAPHYDVIRTMFASKPMVYIPFEESPESCPEEENPGEDDFLIVEEINPEIPPDP